MEAEDTVVLLQAFHLDKSGQLTGLGYPKLLMRPRFCLARAFAVGSPSQAHCLTSKC